MNTVTKYTYIKTQLICKIINPHHTDMKMPSHTYSNKRGSNFACSVSTP